MGLLDGLTAQNQPAKGLESLWAAQPEAKRDPSSLPQISNKPADSSAPQKTGEKKKAKKPKKKASKEQKQEEELPAQVAEQDSDSDADSDDDQLERRYEKKRAGEPVEEKEEDEALLSAEARRQMPRPIAHESESKQQTPATQEKKKKKKKNQKAGDATTQSATSKPEGEDDFSGDSGNEDETAATATSTTEKKDKWAALHDPERLARTIFVGGVGLETDRRTIAKLFSSNGFSVESVRKRSIASSKPKLPKKVVAAGEFNHPSRKACNAYVVLKARDQAEAAVNLSGSVLDKRHVTIDMADKNKTKYDPSRSVFIGNVPFEADDEQIWEAFSPCGAMTAVRLVRDKETGMGMGYGFVSFKDAASLKKAAEVQAFMVGQHRLRVHPVIDHKKKLEKFKSRTTAETQKARKSMAGGRLVKGGKVAKKTTLLKKPEKVQRGNRRSEHAPAAPGTDSNTAPAAGPKRKAQDSGKMDAKRRRMDNVRYHQELRAPTRKEKEATVVAQVEQADSANAGKPKKVAPKRDQPFRKAPGRRTHMPKDKIMPQPSSGPRALKPWEIADQKLRALEAESDFIRS